MNNKFHNYITKAGENFSLTPQERERMRRAVHAYMEIKPLRTRTASVPTATHAWFFSMRPVAAALVLALFVSSAGVSYAAEDSLPGDILYPIKTYVNEPVQGALAASAQAKSDWAIGVASTRLQEAATLAAEGRLNGATQEQLKNSFDVHAKVAARLIDEEASTSPDTGATNASSFEAQLSEYERVLAEVGRARGVETAGLTSAIRDTRAKVGTIRAEAEAHAATDTSARAITASRMRDVARVQLKASLKLSRSGDDSLASSSATQVALQLDEASATIEQGQKFLDGNAAPEASVEFQNALIATKRLDVFLKTSAAIHAKTGLRIGEERGGKHEDESAERAIGAPAPNATGTTATSTEATTTDRGDNHSSGGGEEEKHGTSGGANGDSGHGEQRGSDNHLLRLSVPDTFLHQ